MKAGLYKLYKKTVENVLPPLSHSEFKEKGVLTPEEFVLAGDYLVHTCPTWSWESGDASKRWAFLPPEKQYLITKNVPCLQRASALLSYAEYASPATAGQDIEGGDWIATTSASAVAEELDAFEELPGVVRSGVANVGGSSSGRDGTPPGGHAIPDVDDDDEEKQATLRQMQTQSGSAGGNAAGGDGEGGVKQGEKEEEEETIPDISDLDLNPINQGQNQQQENEEEDDAVAPLQPQGKSKTNAPSTATTTSTTNPSSPPSGVLATRTYDLLISYDNYYHVPRVWLIGYSEDRTPLTQKEILEDVMSDYFSHKERKTVTVESHPHRTLGGKVVSIHPCRHAETMHRLAAVVSGNGGGGGDDDEAATESPVKEFKIEHYMVLFLKFISSVVPTIEYDYTMPAGM